MKRHEKQKSLAIKNYYEGLRQSVGLTSKDIAGRLDMTAVNFSNLTTRLDQLTGEKLTRLAVILGVDPGVFLNKITELRKNEVDA